MSPGTQYEVIRHPEAKGELAAIRDPAERAAINHAVEKLAALGPALPYPHSSAIQGKAGAGIRELRPRGGGSPWRAFYARVEEAFVILAIGPEAKVDKRRFNRALVAARKRLDGIEP